MAGKGTAGSRGPPFVLEGLGGCTRSSARLGGASLFRPIGGRCAAPGLLRRRSLRRRRELHACAPRLRQADGDRLFRRARPVLALPDVLDFLAHELTGLRAWRLAFTLGLLGSLNGFLLWHSNLQVVDRPPARISPADGSPRASGLPNRTSHRRIASATSFERGGPDVRPVPIDLPWFPGSCWWVPFSSSWHLPADGWRACRFRLRSSISRSDSRSGPTARISLRSIWSRTAESSRYSPK